MTNEPTISDMIQAGVNWTVDGLNVFDTPWAKLFHFSASLLIVVFLSIIALIVAVAVLALLNAYEADWQRDDRNGSENVNERCANAAPDCPSTQQRRRNGPMTVSSNSLAIGSGYG
jgi:hypothetical protein